MTDVPHLIGGRYELGEVLGRGGMAEVRQGRDIRLDRTVAIKRLRSDLASDVTFQARFRREAQSAAALNHPTIVAVYDTGEEQLAGQTVPYIVMEYVQGRTLRDVLRAQEELLPERSLEIVAGVLRALSYSHHAGIVHRDIKPANVMLTPAGEVKVMDFGIARAIADTSATVTQTAAVIGTAQYLSPEQARGAQVDARSDLYSTGCLLYELLTGRPPFIGDSPVSVAYQHVREEAPPPSHLSPAISRAVDAVVMRALAKSPDDRYQSADDMRHDVERAMRGERTSAATTMLAPPATQLFPAAPPAPVPSQVGYAPEPVRRVETRRVEEYPEEPERRSNGTGWVIAFLAVVLLALAGFIGYQLLNSEEPPADQTALTDVVGMTEDQAATALSADGFALTRPCTAEASDSVAAGDIISQDPEADTPLDAGAAVMCVVSSGIAQTTVPQLTNLTLEQAETALEQAGLQRGSITEENGTVEADRVLGSTPADGEPIEDGGEVDLVIASGQNAVPNVDGQAQAEAEQTLESAGFVVAVETQEDAEAAPDTVIGQDPDPTAVVDLGATVTITVATAPAAVPVPVPDVSDQDLTFAEAAAVLNQAGFTVVENSDDSAEDCQGDAPPDDCFVVAQDPQAETEFEDPAGETVTLTLERQDGDG